MAENSNTKKTKTAVRKAVEALTHDEALRKNIPTAEFRAVVPREVQQPIRIAYERLVGGEGGPLVTENAGRNRDLEPDIDILPVKDGTDYGKVQVKIKGVDVFHRSGGEVPSDGAEGIACWFIDTDHSEEGVFIRRAYFLGANDPYQVAEGGGQRRSLGHAAQRHLAAVRQAQERPDRRESHQSPRRRGDEGVSGRINVEA